jgi:hypothetical protein
MRSSIAGLIWQIWTRRRISIWLVIGITLFSGIVNWMFQDMLRAAREDRFSTGFPLVLELLVQHLALATLLLVLSIFNYTEFNQQKGSAGFPHRLFVLPVTSLRLVAVPMVAGAVAAALIALVWGMWAVGERSSLFTIAFPAYVLLYQGITWTLPGLGAARMLILGVFAFGFITMPILSSLRGVPDTYAAGLIAGLALFSFFACWIWVARERRGGRFNRQGVRPLTEWLSDQLPHREKPFRSAAAAQFWFEWRRSGLVLPILVVGLFLVAIGPLSWSLQASATGLERVLIATLAMPIILALPVGKAFSKPDLWSGDLAVPAVVAVRPLANSDIVFIKMKVAALSAAISWLVVLAFLLLWLSFWGDLDSLPMIQYVLWQVHGESVIPQYAIALLAILAGLFLTWKFLVGNLWFGLSGRKALFTVSAIPYAIVPFFAVAGLIVLTRNEQSIIVWIQSNLDRLLPDLVWIAALAVIAKIWFAAFSWRNTPPELVWRYLLCWTGSSACLIVLAILLSSIVWVLVPSDMYRLRNLSILLALLIMPLARIGMAQSSLARNRHR